MQPRRYRFNGRADYDVPFAFPSKACRVISIVHILVLAVHLLLMNVAVGGPLVCLLLDWSLRRRDNAISNEAGRRLAWWSMWSLVVGGVLGGVLIGLIWLADDDKFFRAVAVVPASRLWFGLAEWLVSAVLLMLYARGWSYGTANWRRYRVLPVLSSTNLAYHFPLLFVAISQIADQPELWDRVLTRAEFRDWLFSSLSIAIAVHVLLASIAVAGVLLMLMAGRTQVNRIETVEAATSTSNQSKGHQNPEAKMLGMGAWIALIATAIQLPVGLWVLLVVPESSRNRLLGDHLASAVAFSAGVLLALWMLHVLLAIALGERTRQKSWQAASLMVGTVVLMTAALQWMAV